MKEGVEYHTFFFCPYTEAIIQESIAIFEGVSKRCILFLYKQSPDFLMCPPKVGRFNIIKRLT